MATIVQPYLFFSGRCDEALAFYKQAIGAETLVLMRFSESPDPVPADMLKPGFEDKVMHSAFKIGETVIMASDGCDDGQKFDAFSLAISVDSEQEVDRLFAGLSDGGEVVMPPAPTFWSPRYGMLKDRFGVHWMIMVLTEGC